VLNASVHKPNHEAHTKRQDDSVYCKVGGVSITSEAMGEKGMSGEEREG
jgi:hypothetical protein